jgi:hypothetical protein
VLSLPTLLASSSYLPPIRRGGQKFWSIKMSTLLVERASTELADDGLALGVL